MGLSLVNNAYCVPAGKEDIKVKRDFANDLYSKIRHYEAIGQGANPNSIVVDHIKAAGYGNYKEVLMEKSGVTITTTKRFCSEPTNPHSVELRGGAIPNIHNALNSFLFGDGKEHFHGSTYKLRKFVVHGMLRYLANDIRNNPKKYRAMLRG